MENWQIKKKEQAFSLIETEGCRKRSPWCYEEKRTVVLTTVIKQKIFWAELVNARAL